MLDIGTLITTARERAGLTQAQLAERAGTSQSAVARLEAGHGNPAIETLRRLVNAAGFDLRLELVPRRAARDSVVEAYKKDVDRTLLRENLAKSVDRRLRDADAFSKAAAELRAGVRAAARKPAARGR